MVKIIDQRDFGFDAAGNQLFCFRGNSVEVALQAITAQHLVVSIKIWDAHQME